MMVRSLLGTHYRTAVSFGGAMGLLGVVGLRHEIPDKIKDISRLHSGKYHSSIVPIQVITDQYRRQDRLTIRAPKLNHAERKCY